MAKKVQRGLGRGLDALLGGLGEEEVNPLVTAPRPQSGDAVVSIRLSDIDPNRDQPRKRFSEEAMNELADLKLLCGNEEQAGTIEENFRRTAELYYNRIMEMLLTDERDI